MTTTNELKDTINKTSVDIVVLPMLLESTSSGSCAYFLPMPCHIFAPTLFPNCCGLLRNCCGLLRLDGLLRNCCGLLLLDGLLRNCCGLLRLYVDIALDLLGNEQHRRWHNQRNAARKDCSSIGVSQGTTCQNWKTKPLNPLGDFTRI